MGIRERLLITESKWRTAVVLFVVLAIQHRLLWQLPIFEIGLAGNTTVYIMRTISAACSVLLIWIFVPHAMERIKLRINRSTLPTIAGFAVVYFGVGYLQTHDCGLPLLAIIDGGIFAWFIGLDEELFGRGLIYGLLENRGREIALAGSAVIFGLEHFTNYLAGKDSFDYVLGHMVSAAGFGYVMAAAMLATGSIWVPIFIHGFVDYRWVLMEPSESLAVTSGRTDWFMIGLTTTAMVIIARLMIADRSWMLQKTSSVVEGGRLNSLLRYLGLVE